MRKSCLETTRLNLSSIRWFLIWQGHNYVVLKDGYGNVVREIHGLAADVLGNWKAIGWLPSDRLIVREFNYSPFGTAGPGVTVFSGSEAEAFAFWGRAQDAVVQLALKNFNYSQFGFDIFSPTENSNSIASSIMASMGFQEVSLGWRLTPGANNILLSASEISGIQSKTPIPWGAFSGSLPPITLGPGSAQAIPTSAAAYFLLATQGISFFTPAANPEAALSLFASQYSGSSLDVYSSFGFTSFASDGLKFGSGSYIDLPSGVSTSNGWFSWDVSSLNLAAGDLINNILASTGGAGSGEQLGFQIGLKSTGDWRVSFSAVSGLSSSSLLDRVRSAGQPHGVASFMNWFYGRAEEWARDVLINHAVSPGPGEEELFASAGEVDVSTVRSVEEEAKPESFSKVGVGDSMQPLPLNDRRITASEPAFASIGSFGIVTAAGALIESMGQWAPQASEASMDMIAGYRRNPQQILDFSVAS